MKNQNKTLCALTCSALISFTSFSAMAQSATDPDSSTTNRRAQVSSYDNQPNYSWLGLLGLIGLAGLLRKREDSETGDGNQVRQARVTTP